MKKKSQIKQITTRALQLTLLLAVFVLVGFILPIYAAPHVADLLGITTPYDAAREVMSVRLEDRNVSDGESFSVAVSDPASSVRISSLSYDCSFDGITLTYLRDGQLKEIPCDVALELPDVNEHRIQVFTKNSAITYMPLNLRLENDDYVGEISLVIATAASGAEARSSLKNVSTATLQSFPIRKSNR